jgi:hypothetical protein
MNDQIDERKFAAALFELITSNSSPDWFTEQVFSSSFSHEPFTGSPDYQALRNQLPTA